MEGASDGLDLFAVDHLQQHVDVTDSAASDCQFAEKCDAASIEQGGDDSLTLRRAETIRVRPMSGPVSGSFDDIIDANSIVSVF